MYENSHRAPWAVSFSFHQHSQSHYQESQTAAVGRGVWAWCPDDPVTSALKPRPPLGTVAAAAAAVELEVVAVVILPRLLVPSAV